MRGCAHTDVELDTLLRAEDDDTSCIWLWLADLEQTPPLWVTDAVGHTDGDNFEIEVTGGEGEGPGCDRMTSVLGS